LSQRPLPDNTQHSQETDIHALVGIRTHNPSKRAAADPRLRPRGHWDRPLTYDPTKTFTVYGPLTLMYRSPTTVTIGRPNYLAYVFKVTVR
jgi:hypothetical protein